ncbi:MAG: CPBP family intramembrane metalloprotease [Bryobacteraceae bacterium]|nr:CPBP family intramembrane metalloprotease [Bryobacteraceae bacterium]
MTGLRKPFWTWREVALFLGLYLPAFFIAGALFRLVPWKIPGKAASSLVPFLLGYSLWFLGLFWILRASSRESIRDGLAWRMPRQGLAISFFGGPLLAIVVSVFGVLLKTPEVDNQIRTWLSADQTSLILTSIFATLLAPFFEEVAFRGFLQPLAIQALGTFFGIVGTAVPFALIHGPQVHWSWQHLLLLSLAGSVFGWIRFRTDSTIGSTLMHSTYNLTQLVSFLATQ